MKLFILVGFIVATSFSCVLSGENGEGTEESHGGVEDYPFEKKYLKFDRKLIVHITNLLKLRNPDSILNFNDAPKILFDGREWEETNQSNHFQILVRKEDKSLPVNKNGKYLIWLLPSSKEQKGRDRIIGVSYSDKMVPRIFYGQLKVLAAER